MLDEMEQMMKNVSEKLNGRKVVGEILIEDYFAIGVNV